MGILQVVLLLAVANGAPILIRRALGRRYGSPLDGGMQFRDGRPLFGRSKTIRGLLGGIGATAAVAEMIGASWEFGALFGSFAMLGDLLSSFVKRRLGMEPSSMARGLDQIPESLFPAGLAAWYMDLGLSEVLAIVALFFAVEVGLSPILFRLRIRKTPY